MSSAHPTPLPPHPISHTGPGTFRAWEIPLMLSAAKPPSTEDWGHRLHRAAAAGTAIRLRPGAFVTTKPWNAAFPLARHLATALSIAMTSRTPPVFARDTALLLHRLPLRHVPPTVALRASSIGAAGTTVRTKPDASQRDLFHEHRLAHPTAWRDTAAADLLPAPFFLDGEVVFRAEDLRLALPDSLPRMDFGGAVMAADAMMSGRRRADDGTFPCTADPLTSHQLLDLAEHCLTKRATAAFRRIVEFASPLSESPGESLSRVRIHELGFQPPELQHEIRDAQGRPLGIVDFWWEELQLAGEFDGKKKYTGDDSYSGRSTDEVIREEKQRVERIQEQGVRFVRWMWSDLTTPRRLAEKLARVGVPRATTTHRRFLHSDPAPS